MTEIDGFELPINDPVLVFTIILFSVLIIPILLRNTKTPAIIGLIIYGIIIGPKALNIIDDNDIVKLFSHIGLLYIMLLAALDIELVEFRSMRNRIFVFGFLSFIVPFLFGYLTSIYVLNLPVTGSVLIGILLASNTLISYPIVKKLNISRISAVSIATSGTVIVDTIVLAALAFVSVVLLDNKQITIGLLSFVISFSVVSLLIFIGIPRLSRWFFRIIPADNNTQFLYVISLLFAASYAAEIAGLEPIIGAFFVGLALNKNIPKSSPLMSHLELVGNTLFIPIFLISVGMLVDIGAIFDNFYTLLVALTLIIIAIISKWIPSLITKFIFKQSYNEMNTVFGLTMARAAATLAIAVVGLNFEVLDKNLFNAIILLILVSSLISSIVTKRYAKKLSLEINSQFYEKTDEEAESILVPIANPDTTARLLELAIYIRSHHSNEPIYALRIITDRSKINKINMADKVAFDTIANQSELSGVKLKTINRFDVNISQSIVKNAKDLITTKLILGWSGQSPDLNKIFGNILDGILRGTGIEVIVCNLLTPLNTMERINIFVPENAENEIGFKLWIKTILQLNTQLGTVLCFYSNVLTHHAIRKVLQILKTKQAIKWQESNKLTDYLSESQQFNHSLYVIISSRPQYISFNIEIWRVTYYIPKELKRRNFLIIYPQQT